MSTAGWLVAWLASGSVAHAGFDDVDAGIALGGSKQGGVAMSDIDRDGDLDIVALSNGGEEHTQVYRNDGGLSFTRLIDAGHPLWGQGAAGTLSRSVLLADLDHDGDADLVRVGGSGLEVWAFTGSGYAATVSYQYTNDDAPDGYFNAEGATLLDLDGDGWLDIVTDADGGPQVFLNDGNLDFTVAANGAFGLPEHSQVPSVQADYYSSGDVNGDGLPDLVAHAAFTPIWVADGKGSYVGHSLLGATSSNHDGKGGVALCDLDDDGDHDVLWGGGPNHDLVAYANDWPSWQADIILDDGEPVNAPVCGDVDLDGDLDVLVTRSHDEDYVSPDTHHLFLNQPVYNLVGPPDTGTTPTGTGSTGSTGDTSITDTGTPPPPPIFGLEEEQVFVGDDGYGAAFGDLDLDGDLDLLINEDGALRLLVNDDNPAEPGRSLFLELWTQVGTCEAPIYRVDWHASATIGGATTRGRRELAAGTGRGSMGTPWLHFVVPEDQTTLSLDLTWVHEARYSKTVRRSAPLSGGPRRLAIYDDDLDGDGIPNDVESGDFDGDGDLDELDLDADADGLLDADEAGPNPCAPRDSDGDSRPDYVDDDDDGDTIPTVEELAQPDPDPDDDGIPNYLDLDSDNDGLRDDVEAAEGTGPYTLDSDGGGTPDGAEVFWGTDPLDPSDDDEIGVDTDGDGLPDGREAPGDTDGDGIPNIEDPDDDDDGLPTELEVDGDSDGDGDVDAVDPDDDDDGVPTSQELDNGAPRDTDGDGLPDHRDPDDDDDGIPTADEGTGDPDGDGIPNYLDDDSDGDGVPDGQLGNGAADSDGDGLTDTQEAALGSDPTDADSDDDGIPDGDEASGDTDADGVPDVLDPDDDGDGRPTEDEGAGDLDGDGVPAYLDDDSDDDGIPDAEEGDGDTDGDGLPDWADADDGGLGLPPTEATGCGCASGALGGSWGLALLAGLLFRRRR